MVTVRELKGLSHVFTLTDGSTFRLLPNQEKQIPDSSVSEDMQRGVDMGFIVVLREIPKVKPAVEEHMENPIPKKAKNKQEV